MKSKIYAVLVLTVVTIMFLGCSKEPLNNSDEATREEDLSKNETGNYIKREAKENTAEEWFNKAKALFVDGEFTNPQKALEYCNNAIIVQPNYADAYNCRGTVYFDLGQYQRGIDDYNEAIRLNPNFGKAYFNRGRTYCILGQYKRGIDDYNEAIRRLKLPDSGKAYKDRGIAYFELGKNNLGCRDAQKACAFGDCELLVVAKGKRYCR
jgi:tetratricopeptide (TPR) repeat protein